MAGKKLSRRKFLSGAATIASTVALSACAPKAPGVISSQNVKLKIWSGTTYATAADAAQDEQIMTWAEKNNVELDYARMSVDERQPRWKTALESRQFPDMGALETDQQPTYLVAGLLVETTKVVERLNKLEGGYTEGAFWSGITADGKHWVVPSHSTAEVLYIRKDKLDEKGLKVPETYEDCFEAAKAITTPGSFWGWGCAVTGGTNDAEQWLNPALWAYGARAWDVKAQKPAIDSKETRQFLDLLVDAWKSGCIPPDVAIWDDSSNNKNYITGILGMTINQGSILAAMEKDGSPLLEKTILSQTPKGPKGRFGIGYYHQWGVFKGTKNADACLDLLEYLLAPEQLRPVYDKAAGDRLPVFKNLLSDPMWAKSQGRQTIVDQVANTYPMGYTGPTTPWVVDAWLDRTVGAMCTRVVHEGWDSDKAIAEAETKIKKWYDDWQVKVEALKQD